MRRVRQITIYHCGPAVLEMLASFYHVTLYQDQLVKTGKAASKLHTHGMTIDDLALAASKTLPSNLQFWYKHNSTARELAEIVNVHQHPVGVEWQGVFEEEEDEDSGHYSIVTQISLENNLIIMADPYRRYAGKDRSFPLNFFEERWWDVNEVINPQTKKKQALKDFHSFFLIVDKQFSFPERLSMTRGY
ncbi:hypothetical protein A2160_01550 [Candidatus Beckwithbacteria bacterium RBG_13_42_9]|uniref:Peptidase C39 domain-containing protein n=1 Tax=Candidatus Beckwithbacteria bacterium RBG_13_42_9 TaxID=1797457 RepID=A0A1F5E953_9BACT|nr:MAG: hypothetical protein A2160_01550 [Candidatus Beckwithbacteria bacterium RBG_13_42_9]